MINKIYKRIHNKYSNIFKFFFFLRYLFTIFLIFTSLFFLIPKFFDYEKKQEIIKEYLSKYYHLELNDYSKIKYKIFPLPNLSIKNANLKIIESPIILNSNNIDIFLKLKNIYNYKNFKANKILLNQNELSVDLAKSQDLINYFKKLKYKLAVKNLNLNLKKNNNSIIKIKNIKFYNYGYKKYYFNGEVFDKKLKVNLVDKNKKLNIKILNSGIKATFIFSDKILKDSFEGTSKIRLLNNFLKFNFELDANQLKIKNSNFRNKDLSFSFDSSIILNPYLKINSNININEIESNLINIINLDKVLNNMSLLKKLDSKIKINYTNKSYFPDLIKAHTLDVELINGRLVFSNIVFIGSDTISCKGNSLLADEYPRLNFNCNFAIKNKKKFIKKFSISKKISQDKINFNLDGSLNLLKKKAKFKKINFEENYLTNKEDVKYFQETFESILFDDGFFQIFKKKKIKEFILAII